MRPMTRAGPARRVGSTPTELKRITFRNKRYGLERGKSATMTAALLACFEPHEGMRAFLNIVAFLIENRGKRNSNGRISGIQ
jgi:hypothetical protein